VLALHRTRIFGNRGYRPYGADETITAAEFGPDEVAVLAESLAQRGDLNLEISRVDKNARPNKGHEFVLRDKRPVGVDEDHQDIYGASAKFDRYTIGEQLPAPSQQAETAELERRIGREWGRRMPEHFGIISPPRLALLCWNDRS
jgi:hypothetical protein